MKRLFLGILIFAIVSFSVTGILINQKNSIFNEQNISNNNSGNLNEDNENQNINIPIKEKTIDLYGTYDENDLEIYTVSVDIELKDESVEIPAINGLKNKFVEEKINNDIKNRVLEELKDISNKNGIESIVVYYGIKSNFSNILSLIEYITYKHNDEWMQELVCLNYELINGERLEIEDLFVQDADLHSIVRRCFYRPAAQNEVTSMEFYDLHFDAEKGEWLATYWDFETGEEVERIYIPPITEYEINKMIKNYINNEEKEFYFTPSRIYIVQDGNAYSYYLELKDIADNVTIYDKYLTNESLYETSDIGKKNLWTCSEPNSRNEYLNYGFAEDNLFYEISTDRYSYYYISEKFPFEKSVKKIQEELLASANDKLEEYKEIAKENKDKFYILRQWCHIDNESYDEICNLAVSNIDETLYKVDINLKDEIMDKLIECYRYYNLSFYSSAFELLYNYELPIENFYESGIRKSESKVYDLRNLEEITSIGEIFKDNIDYMSLINEKLKLEIRNRKNYNISEEELNKLVEEAIYSLSSYGIVAKIPGFDYNLTIYYSNIDKSILTIYELELYIIPESNTRNIEKTEIQDLSLDELNKAYNEIFARHGHDFKNLELKVYFEGLLWYEKVANKSVSLEELSEIEKYNLDVIKEVIEEKKK